MTKKAMKVAALIVALVAVFVTAGVVTASTKTARQLPEYVGSQACLGCHSDKYVAWQDSLHSTSFRSLVSPSDYPADVNTAPAELKAELEKADLIWRGKRFLAQDPVTGELKYLNVQYNFTTKMYEAYKGGGVWSQSCGGCHSGSVNAGVVTKQIEAGIGCESCHGPGREHILGKGDVSKIVSTTEPSKSCAQCHSGYNTITGAARFAQGYRPGTKIEEFAGFKFPEYDDTKSPPAMGDNHMQQYPQWKASGHANATNLLIARGETYLNRQECIKCHSTSAGLQIADGVTFEASKHLVNDGVSCVACHDVHGSTIPGQLKMEPQALCISCHSIGRGNPAPVKIGTTRAPHSPQADMLAGTGALGGVADTTGAHTGIGCIECHMSEGNHMMNIIKPGDVIGTTRKDSCSACHTNSSAESRDVYLTLWEESITGKLDVIAIDVKVIEERLKANANALTADQKKSFESWRANFWYVQKDNSKGAHNFEYAVKVLSQAQKEIAKLRREMK